MRLAQETEDKIKAKEEELEKKKLAKYEENLKKAREMIKRESSRVMEEYNRKLKEAGLSIILPVDQAKDNPTVEQQSQKTVIHQTPSQELLGSLKGANSKLEEKELLNSKAFKR